MQSPGITGRVLATCVAVVVVASMVAMPVHSMTRRTVTMTCPYDGTTFSFDDQASGTAFDQTLDNMAMGAIQSPSPMAVYPTDGFVFFKDDISKQELQHLRPAVFSPEFKALAEEAIYYRAAWLARKTNEPRNPVVSLLLRATWQERMNAIYRLKFRSSPPDADVLNVNKKKVDPAFAEQHKSQLDELEN